MEINTNENVDNDNRDSKRRKIDMKSRGIRGLSSMVIEKVYGKGNYGVVFKAADKETGQVVALKKISMEKETNGFPIPSIREIKILKSLKHQNIVDLKEMVAYNASDGENSIWSSNNIKHGDIFMVLEFCDFDLAGLLKNPHVILTENHIKSFMQQLLTGAFWMHKNNILHRDIKPANLLITRGNVLKIADWGMARGNVPKDGKFSYGKKCTLWYRSPELLYGARQYGYEVDIWSIGCIFGELKTRTPMLQGNDEQKQLDLLYRLCGSPIGACEDKLKTLPDWEKYETPKPCPSRLRTQYASSCDIHSLDLLDKLLDVNPNSRITADKALDAEYFWTDLLPPPEVLPRFDSVDGTTEMAEVERQQLEYEKQKEAIKLAEEERIKRDSDRKIGGGRGIGGRDGRGNSNRGGFNKPKSSSSSGPKFTIKKSTSQAALSIPVPNSSDDHLE